VLETGAAMNQTFLNAPNPAEKMAVGGNKSRGTAHIEEKEY